MVPRGVGNVTGNPGVFQGNPYPWWRVRVLMGTGYGFSQIRGKLPKYTLYTILYTLLNTIYYYLYNEGSGYPLIVSEMKRTLVKQE